MIVPIGMQCTVASLKSGIGEKGESLPFDSMLSHPKFVYSILVRLLNGEDVEKLTEEHFFCCDKHATRVAGDGEHYRTDPKGKALLNTKYNVIFPHDDVRSEENVMKYARRLRRLKALIEDSNQKLTFMYISQASKQTGDFTLDGVSMTTEISSYLSQIRTLLLIHHPSSEFVVLTTEDLNLPHDVTIHRLSSCNSWVRILDQVWSRNIYTLKKK